MSYQNDFGACVYYILGFVYHEIIGITIGKNVHNVCHNVIQLIILTRITQI